jgi:AraC-like DNA-binding protein
LRLDFWFFQGYLLGLGPLAEEVESSHQAIQLAVSFNHPMKVTIEGEDHECTLLAIDSQISHKIEGALGWQFFGFIHPQSQLGGLVRDRIDQTGGRWFYENKDLSKRDPINPSINDRNPSYRIRELWEFLLFHLLGIRSYSLGWSQELSSMLNVMDKLPLNELNLKKLSEIFNKYPRELETRFFQMAGIPLVHYIFNTKLVHASDLIKRGMSFNEAIGASGLSGSSSAAAYMKNLYGLDLEFLLKEEPHVRFFSTTRIEQLSGHAL